MLAHGKVEPLDGLIHHYVGLCMAAVALAVMGHALWPRSFAWGAAKSLALLMEVRNACHASKLLAIVLAAFGCHSCAYAHGTGLGLDGGGG